MGIDAERVGAVFAAGTGKNDRRSGRGGDGREGRQEKNAGGQKTMKGGLHLGQAGIGRISGKDIN